MLNQTSNTEAFVVLLEQLIDSRFKYLKELDYENHRHAAKILKEEYNPLVETLKEFLEKNA